MTPISSRHYGGGKDFQTMLDLQDKIYPASYAKNYPVKEVKI